jgi:CubicO group peptidase (beta-lactamase class C family)
MITKGHKISSILILSIFILMHVYGCSSSASSSSNAGTDYTATIENTSAYIESAITQYNLVGLGIALVDNDRIVWSQGFGFADKELKTPATADTVFMIGSVSKTLTTAALLNLYDKGLIELDAPITSYLPEFDMAARFPGQMQGITVRRLLNHHSGIPGDIWNAGFVEEMWDDWNTSLYIDWLYSYLRDDYPAYAPGQIASYCNTGFVLAGEIVRRAGGADTFTSYMQENLLAPLGMSRSSFRKITDNAAMGYVNGQPVPGMEANLTATGGAYSTVIDMSQFIMMLLGEGLHPNGTRILNPETVALMGREEKSQLDIFSYFNPGPGFDITNDYAMSYAGRAWIKDGSTTNFESVIELLPDRKLGVVVLCNSNTAGNIKYAIARECLKNALIDKYDIHQSMPALPIIQSIHDSSQISGIYAGNAKYHKVIDNGDGTVTLSLNANTSSPTSLTLSYDGSMYACAGCSQKYSFKNISWGENNYQVLIQVGSSGSDMEELSCGGYAFFIMGQKIAPLITPAWTARLGKTYIIDNFGFNDIGWGEASISFSTKNGLLLGGKYGAQNVLEPDAVDDDLAWVAGINNRGDSCVRVEPVTGGERVTIGGYSGYDIDLVSDISIGDVIIGSTRFHHTDWYRLTIATPGQNIGVATSGTNPQYTLVLFDSTLKSPVAFGQGSLDWESITGTYYLGITPSPADASEYTLSITAY